MWKAARADYSGVRCEMCEAASLVLQNAHTHPRNGHGRRARTPGFACRSGRHAGVMRRFGDRAAAAAIPRSGSGEPQYPEKTRTSMVATSTGFSANTASKILK